MIINDSIKLNESKKYSDKEKKEIFDKWSYVNKKLYKFTTDGGYQGYTDDMYDLWSSTLKTPKYKNALAGYKSVNDSIKLNKSKIDVSHIEVDPTPFNYEGFHGVNLTSNDRNTIKKMDNAGFRYDLSKAIGYEIQMSGLPGVLRVNIKNKDFKSAYNDIKSKLSALLNEAYTKPKVDPGTKYVMMVDDEVVMQFNSKQSMDQYRYNMSKNPNAFMGTFMKVINGSIVPLNEDTIKTDKGWTNKGKSGKTHGYFKSKKDADAQRKAMFASGYKA